MNWMKRQDVEAILVYNKSIEHILLVRPDLKRDYYILANKVAGAVNMLIQEDGEEFAMEFRKVYEPLLVNAQFRIVKAGCRETINTYPIWGAINKKALEKARKKAESKKHEAIKEAMRETLKGI